MAAKRSSNWMYCIHVSMVEIYSEQIYDLLSESPGNKLKIKQGPQGNYVPGLTWVEAKDVEAAKSVSGSLLVILCISNINQYNSV